MLFTSDIEIIKSAILYGDIKDVMSIIEKKIHSLTRYKGDRANLMKQNYVRFLTNLKNTLSGSISVDEFKDIVSANNLIGWFSPDPDIRDEFLNSFCYFLKVSIDRYDVRYPVFDEKRCNDA